MKIVDSVIFFNELDLLEARLEYLYDHVDHFLIVESSHTFTGNPKPLYFKENESLFAKYADKITSVQLILPEDYDFSSPWNLENYQRNYISQCVDGFDDDDIIGVSDLDEIPNREKLQEIKQAISQSDGSLVVYPKMFYFYYNLRTRVKNYNIAHGSEGFDGMWIAPFFTKKSKITKITANNLRFRTDPYKKTLDQIIDMNELVRLAEESVFNPIKEDLFLEDGGWHLTYFMSEERIKLKLESFAHTEYDTDYHKNIERLKECISEKKDLFDREDHELLSIEPKEFFSEEFLRCFGKWGK